MNIITQPLSPRLVCCTREMGYLTRYTREMMHPTRSMSIRLDDSTRLGWYAVRVRWGISRVIHVR